ncbi:MAG TPA: hypothetical protein VF279_06580, partial [Acidimicrobiales bacterium]
MNEHPNEEQGSESMGGEAAGPVPPTTEPVPPVTEATAPVAWPATDPSVTQQQPLTQPVPQVQPPYPGQPIGVAEGDVYPAGAHPAPTGPWVPAPAPGTWGVAAAPGWGPLGPAPLPAPGGWGSGVG